MYFWWMSDWYNGAAYAGRAHPPLRDHRADIETSVVAAPDRQLLRVVVEALLTDPAVTGGRLDVQLQNGVVIVEGEVDTADIRAAVVERAWSVPGVVDVCDIILVTGRRRREP
jgi:hypothetical protein